MFIIKTFQEKLVLLSALFPNPELSKYLAYPESALRIFLNMQYIMTFDIWTVIIQSNVVSPLAIHVCA